MEFEEPGYLPAIVGGLMGLVIGGLLLGCGGFVYFSYMLRNDPEGLPGLGAIFVAFPGALIGQVIGCWAALRLGQFEAAGTTAIALTILSGLGATFWIWSVFGSNDLKGFDYACLSFWPVILPGLARAIIVRMHIH